MSASKGAAAEKTAEEKAALAKIADEQAKALAKQCEKAMTEIVKLKTMIRLKPDSSNFKLFNDNLMVALGSVSGTLNPPLALWLKSEEAPKNIPLKYVEKIVIK